MPHKNAIVRTSSPKLKSISTMLALSVSVYACTSVENAGQAINDAASTASREVQSAASALGTPNTQPSQVPDTRTGLKSGLYDAETAAWNLKLASTTPLPIGFFDPRALWSPTAATPPTAEGEEAAPPPPNPISFANSDLAFSGDRVIMGNFHGFNVYEVYDESNTRPILSVACPGGQGDVSVHGDLVFYSVEQNRARLDCGAGGVEGTSSEERFRGVRIFDISDINDPKQVAAVQTCRGSHTNTLVPHPTDPNIVYIYNSGTSGVRPGTELEGCSSGSPEENADTSLYSIDIIKVPLNAPEKAEIINSPRIFADRETGRIDGLWKGGALGEGAQTTSATVACHDITAYPEYNLAAGACSGNGILIDISDPENPSRIDEISDPNMAFWHSATFTNDASKILFGDEWGGGVAARCTPEDPETWGADIVVDRTENGLEGRGFYKIPNTQTDKENCVTHNGSLIPVPGRDIMVQGFYSGGISIFDFTDSNNPFEIAFFDRGPIADDALYLAGNWAAYWHNGQIFAPEIVRGLDVYQLVASDMLSENEIAAAKLIQYEEANTQTQTKFEWPASPVVAGAYLDQLNRGSAIDNRLATRTASEIARWKDGRPRARRMRSLARDLKTAANNATGRDINRFNQLATVLENAR